jgi:hypothetical protein
MTTSMSHRMVVPARGRKREQEKPGHRGKVPLSKVQGGRACRERGGEGAEASRGEGTAGWYIGERAIARERVHQPRHSGNSPPKWAGNHSHGHAQTPRTSANGVVLGPNAAAAHLHSRIPHRTCPSARSVQRPHETRMRYINPARRTAAHIPSACLARPHLALPQTRARARWPQAAPLRLGTAAAPAHGAHRRILGSRGGIRQRRARSCCRRMYSGRRRRGTLSLACPPMWASSLG